MSSPKKIIFGDKQREGVLAGITEQAEAAAQTLGPRGRLVAIAKGVESHFTKDGISVIKSIGFSNQQKQIGLQMITEASHKVAYLAGDGTTTTAILTAELCKVANKLISQGFNVRDVLAGFDAAEKEAQTELIKYKRVISGEEDIYNIAKISANNDDEIASNVLKAFQLIGDDGVVTLADSLSRKGETTVEYSDGTEIDAGWPTVHYCNVSMNTCEYANPKFLFFKDPVLDKTTLIPIMQMASERDEPLIIMAPDFDDEILLIGSQNAAQHRFKGCLLFTPGSSVPAKEDTVKDLAAQLGAKVIGLDIRPEEFKYDNHLGQAEHVLIKKQSTVIAGAKHDETDFENYCNNLRYEIETDNAGKSEYELEKLKERLAHLTGGVATIKVGDFTQIALQEKKDRYEDAICAVRAAVGDGILPGGGSPLLRISYSKVKLPANAGVAMKEFLHALSSVAKRLIDTADENAEEIIPKVIHKSKTFGFNAKTGKVADLFKEGVIDPYSVVKQAITYASATAKTFAKLDATVINEQENLSGDRLDPMQELI